MLKSESCYIRPLRIEDIDDLNKWNSDEEVMKYLGGGYHPVSKDLQIKWLNNMMDTSAFSTNKRYMICDNNNYNIGLVGLYSINWINKTSEVGIYIGEIDFQNKGIASQAYQLLEEFAKNNLNLRKLKAYVVKKNHKAVKFWEKNNYKIKE